MYALILLIMLIIILLSQRLPLARIKRWRKRLQLDKHQPVFNNIYASVNGFLLSKKARASQDALEFVYGEIDFEAFIALISLCKPSKNSVFYDLGSGIGKAVLAVALVFDVRKSCGIEWFADLHHSALDQKAKLIVHAEYAHLAKIICFKRNDFLNEPLDEATLVFINATAFFGDYWRQISNYLEQTKSGTLIISTSKAIASDYFMIKKITKVKMSWGVVEAFIQERR